MSGMERCNSRAFKELHYCFVAETEKCIACNDVIADNTPYTDVSDFEASEAGPPLIYLALVCATRADPSTEVKEGCGGILCCHCVFQAFEENADWHGITHEAHAAESTASNFHQRRPPSPRRALDGLKAENIIERKKAFANQEIAKAPRNDTTPPLKYCEEIGADGMYVPDKKRFKHHRTDRPCANVDCPNITLLSASRSSRAYLKEPYVCNCGAVFCEGCGGRLSLAAAPLKGAVDRRFPHLEKGFRMEALSAILKDTGKRDRSDSPGEGASGASSSKRTKEGNQDDDNGGAGSI